MTPRRPLLLLLPFVLLALAASAAARLDAKAWAEVEEQALRLFGTPGQRQAKADVVARLGGDGERRSWKLLVDGLVKEAEAWIEAEKGVQDKETQIQSVQSKPMAKRYPEEQENLRKWQEELKGLEAVAVEQRGAFGDITAAVAQGPDALRQSLLQRAKAAPEWPVRAAAVRVAAAHLADKEAYEFLLRSLEKDKDPRVRMAGVEAMAAVLSTPEAPKAPTPGEGATYAESAASLVIGRLADPDWGVQLLAVRIVTQHGMKRAVPHLINALAATSPRVAEAIGETLRAFTGQNFDPYADVWAKWWEDNREKFESDEAVQGGPSKRPFSDIHFYGLPIKSDRILFIIDVSDSMKHKTENVNPAEKWKPTTPTEDPNAPPPPPPPEEILSGPKIDVAKHELKKALKQLPRTAMFNLIAFNSAVVTWKDTMVEASEKNVEDALQWVRALGPKGSTYIDGALRTAFKIAGMGTWDRAYPEVYLDTIVLLSDGAPTDDGYPEAKDMDPEIILQHVREWNQFHRVVVHCIGIDMQPWIEFLKKLAAENGGTYVDR